MIVEQRVRYEEYVPGGSGSADCLIIGNGEMVVVDFKYGAGIAVEVENNPQLRLYAIGCLLAFDPLYDIDAVKMCIVQPRRDNIASTTVTKESLYKWVETVVKPAAELAWNGEGRTGNQASIVSSAKLKPPAAHGLMPILSWRGLSLRSQLNLTRRISPSS